MVLTPTSALPSGTITVTCEQCRRSGRRQNGRAIHLGFLDGVRWGRWWRGCQHICVYRQLTNIAGFAIAADGSAVPVPGSPFALAGAALAASPSGNFVFGSGPGIYTYSVGANGSLSTASSTTQLPPDPVTGAQVPPGSGPAWLATDPTGATLYGGEVNGSPSTGDQWMGEYAIGSSGSLSLLGAIDTKDTIARLYFTSDSRYAYYGVAPPMQSGSGIVFATRNSDGTLTRKRRFEPSSSGGRTARSKSRLCGAQSQ